MPTSNPYIYWRGVRMDSNSIPSLLMAEKKSGVTIRATQGGYNRGGVAASAGTHDGGAVIDISTSGMSPAARWSLLLWLRRCGWAAWLRTPSQGFIYHIHAVRIGDASASRGAKAQVYAYKNGRNGLANNRSDDGPDTAYVTWDNSKYNPKNAPKPVNKEPYRINGKDYKPMNVVSVYWVNAARKRYLDKKESPVSRHVHRLQVWLHKNGKGYYKQKPDGRWSDLTQKALDSFRRNHLKWKSKSDYAGPLGISSLSKAKAYGATTNKYGVKEGK